MDQTRETNAAPPPHSVVALQGKSGEIYGFTAFPLTAPPPAAGIYMIARPAEPADRARLYWTPLYIGEASDLCAEIDALVDRLTHARKLGATHILVRFCDRGAEVRLQQVEDLVAVVEPTLNKLERANEAA